MLLRVTACELPEYGPDFEQHWQALAAHVAAERSDLVVLPEMPFAPWLATRRGGADAEWDGAVALHAAWMQRLAELGAPAVAGSAAVTEADVRRNAGFAWSAAQGVQLVHRKHYLPDEPGYWEASWYQAGSNGFHAFDAGGVRAGMQICTDLWSLEDSRRLGRQGAQLLLVPRATPAGSRDKWLAGGRTAGVVAGAFTASSNRADAGDGLFGGLAWITGPEGEVLGTSSPDAPFVTVAIDLTQAAAARSSYPRYVPYRD
jgi:N-carbamoylputrescine amidase